MATTNIRITPDIFVPITIAATVATTTIFTAPIACTLVGAVEVHSTAGSDGSAVSLQISKDTGTDAPGAGTALLTNNSNAGFNLKATANTVQTGTFITTAGALTFAIGDRATAELAGTPTAVAGMNVTLQLRPV